MPNRTATFVSAILVASLASLALVTESHSVTPAAETCLSKPKGIPPQGGHWYYRVDRATKRHCWYVGEAGTKVARVAPTASSSVKPSTAQPELAASGSVADARAELLMPQGQLEPSVDIGAAQRMPASPASDVGRENAQNPTPDGTTLLRQAFASRWPGQSSAPASSGPVPPRNNAVSNAQPASEGIVVATPETQLITADALASTRTASIHMLLLVIVGALAVAGIMGSVIFRFGSMRSGGWPRRRDRRRGIWDSVDSDRTPAVYPRAARRNASDAEDRIAQMLTRLSGSPAR